MTVNPDKAITTHHHCRLGKHLEVVSNPLDRKVSTVVSHNHELRAISPLARKRIIFRRNGAVIRQHLDRCYRQGHFPQSRQGFATEGKPHPLKDQAVSLTTGIHNPRLFQYRQLKWRRLDSPVGARHRRSQHRRDALTCLCDALDRRIASCPGYRQDRAFDGSGHCPVGIGSTLGECPRKFGTRNRPGVPDTSRQPGHNLRQDHSGVAPRTKNCPLRSRPDHRTCALIRDPANGFDGRPHRQVHVRASIPIGNREYIQGIDDGYMPLKPRGGQLKHVTHSRPVNA